jgi:FkbM family methyltransferase
MIARAARFIKRQLARSLGTRQSPAPADRAGRISDLQIYAGYEPEHLAVFDAFEAAAPQPRAGFVTDFHGSRARIASLWNGVEHLDGAVLPKPIPGDYHAEAVEWIGVLKSVLAGKRSFIAMEVGAGMGPWLVAGAVAARLRGVHTIRLTGVEADPGRFALLRRHLLDNGFEPDQHTLIQAAVGVQGGTAQWPYLADPRNHAGARPVGTAIRNTMATESTESDYDGTNTRKVIDIAIVPFADLLKNETRWDLVHVDVQGDECDLCRTCSELLSQRVRYLVVGTHSRKLDGELLEIMFKAGWVLEHEKPTRFVYDMSRESLEVMTTHDGTQVWRNPRL